MGSGSIGIKLADNNFFPVMDDGVKGSKTLELTTVRKNQDSVQIHLYRSMNQTLDNAEYIGTLTIRDIDESQAGHPTIRLKITLDGAGELSAEAVDADSGARQSLNVSLGDLSKEALETHQDFDITGVDSGDAGISAFGDIGIEDIGLEIEEYQDEEDGGGIDFGAGLFEETHANAPVHNSFPEAASFTESPVALYASNFDSGFAESKPVAAFLPGGGTSDTSDSGESAKGRKAVAFPPWHYILILVLGIAALITASVFAWRHLYSKEVLIVSEPAPAPARHEGNEGASAFPEEESTPPPVWGESSAVVVAAPELPQMPEAPPAARDAQYLIRWGDTLWDIAETYYRNPWRYSRIAQHNGIDNPNHIIAGTYIAVPAE